jgi:hypothetical protein
MYLRIINNVINYPYSLQKLREDNIRVSFPSEISENLMNEWDIHEVRATPKPSDYTKNISEETPILVDGIYYQNWIQTDATQSEIDLRISDKWDVVRDQRNTLLQECDWTQLADIPQETKDLWSTYRQQLRDITTQSNPYSITWPVKP